jgi:hypothetical protein
MAGVQTNLFASRAALRIFVVGTLLLSFVFRILAFFLVKQVAKIDRRRKRLAYLIPLTPVKRKTGQNRDRNCERVVPENAGTAKIGDEKSSSSHWDGSHKTTHGEEA